MNINELLNFAPLLTIAVSLLGGLVGGYVSHHLSAVRDKAKNRQNLALEQFQEIWDNLEASNERLPIEYQHPDGFFRAISRIQLYGDSDMIDYVDEEVERVHQAVEGTKFNTTPLLYMLRERIRKELGLPQVSRNKYHFLVRTPTRASKATTAR